MAGDAEILSAEAAQRRATARLAAAGVEHPALEARILLAHALGREENFPLVAPQKILTEEQHKLLNNIINRRERHEPIAYILGKKEFWSLDFLVTRDTLIPRPDSETLVEAVLAEIKDRAFPLRWLEFGAGTGCLLISVLKELPDSTGVGVDISAGALNVARENARRLGVADRARFVQSDWGAALDGEFDVVISNPPYVRSGEVERLMPDVARYEPHLALSGGEDGLDAYRAIAEDAARLLAGGGLLALEIGIGQEEEVKEILRGEGMHAFRTAPDLAGTPRCVLARKQS